MDSVKFKEVDDAVAKAYKDLAPIVIEVTRKPTEALNKIIASIDDNMTDRELNSAMLHLSIECYNLSNYVEHANIKAECAETIMKENQSRSFIEETGSNDVKKNKSLLNTIEEQAVTLMYEGVSNILKTKLNEGHRMVDTLKSLQISRQAQSKTEVSRRTLNEDI